MRDDTKNGCAEDYPWLGFHENYLLADYITLISLRILGKFLWNFSEMLKSIFSLFTDPLPSIKIGGEAGGGGGSVNRLSIFGFKRV